MPKSYKILGQQAPIANTNTNLYVVPASTQAVVSTLAFVNRSPSANANIRVAVIPNGQSVNNQHYLEYDKILDGRESGRLTIGMSLNAGDTVMVRASTANVSFSLFGVEITEAA